MENNTVSGTKINKDLIRSIAVIVCAVLLWIIFLYVFQGRFTVNTHRAPVAEADIKSRIVTSDGITTDSIGYDFIPLNKGDFATFTINSSKYFDSLQNPVLYFTLYNCHVKVYADDKLIYEQPVEPGKEMVYTGNYMYKIPVPVSDRLRIEAYCLSLKAVSNIQPRIVAADQVWQIPLEKNTALFILLLTFQVIGILMFFITLLKSIVERKLSIGVSLFALLTALSAWCFFAFHMGYILIDDVVLAAKTEYYMLFIAPFTIALFMRQLMTKGVFRFIADACIAGNGIYLIAVFAYGMLSEHGSLNDFLPVTHLWFVAITALLVAGIFTSKDFKGSLSTAVLKIGLVFSIALCFLEFGVYNFGYKFENQVGEFSIAPYAVIAVTVTLMTYYCVTIMEDTSEKMEKENLELLAYRDRLTGLPNRAALDKYLDSMIEDGVKNYTLVFIDLNNLKLANDDYGHDTGDLLIKELAFAVRKSFAAGFSCRWGGDEFVAIIPGSREEGQAAIRLFHEYISVINSGDLCEVKISAALGSVVSSEAKYIKPTTAIRQADIRMYARKKEMKKASETEVGVS